MSVPISFLSCSFSFRSTARSFSAFASLSSSFAVYRESISLVRSPTSFFPHSASFRLFSSSAELHSKSLFKRFLVLSESPFSRALMSISPTPLVSRSTSSSVFFAMHAVNVQHASEILDFFFFFFPENFDLARSCAPASGACSSLLAAV